MINDLDGLQHGIISSRRLSVDEALQIIRDESGRRYDPAVVDALLQEMGRMTVQSGPEHVLRPSELKPGMTLSRDLLTADGMLLLAADQTLHAGLIRRIMTYVIDERVRDLNVHVH